jgi:hypothetical protein
MVTPRSVESNMGSGEKCLRTLVGKWFGSPPVVTILVLEFSRTRTGRKRYVRIGTARADRSLTIVFFRHDDGSWNVFPEEASRPAMRAYALAA